MVWSLGTLPPDFLVRPEGESGWLEITVLGRVPFLNEVGVRRIYRRLGHFEGTPRSITKFASYSSY